MKIIKNYGCARNGGKGGSGANGGRGRDGADGVSMDLFTIGDQTIEVLEDSNPPAINTTNIGICGESTTISTTETTSESIPSTTLTSSESSSTTSEESETSTASDTVTVTGASDTDTGAVSETGQDSSGDSVLIVITLIAVIVLLIISLIVCIVIFLISRMRRRKFQNTLELTSPQFNSTFYSRMNTVRSTKFV